MNYTLIISLISSLFYFSCSKKSGDYQKEVVRPVKYTIVQATSAKTSREYSGVVTAQTASKLSFKISGNVLENSSYLGQTVKKGQVLMELDKSDIRLEITSFTSRYSEAQAKFKSIKSDHGRMELLYENNNLSKSDLEKSMAQYNVMKAKLKTIESKINLLKLKLSYADLVAPYSGVISRVLIEKNENVSAGRPVIILESSKIPVIKIQVSENVISKIKSGQKVNIFIEALKRQFSGTIKEVGISSDKLRTLYPVVVSLTNADSQVLSGMSAKVGLNWGRHDFNKSAQIILPSHSIEKNNNGTFVWLASKSNKGLLKVMRRKVTIGGPMPGGIQVLSGVRSGEMIITAGISKLTEGMIVRPLGKLNKE
jgi:membrane fusion protein, multidrug efflux system